MAQALLVRRLRRRPETLLWWLMLLAGWGSTQLPTVGTPNGARGVGYMPTLIYFAAAGLEGIKAVLERMTAGSAWIDRRLPAAVLLLVILATGYANVRHYVAWQRSPRTRQDRYLYITAREFPEWAAYISDRARNNRGTASVEGWRADHPVQSAAEPYGPSTTQ
jgi:hypothetical protein